jgi:hypothetical protein
VGFEPTIPVFKRVKTVHATERVATGIGTVAVVRCNSLQWERNAVLWRTREIHAIFQVNNFLEIYRLENRGHEKIKVEDVS